MEPSEIERIITGPREVVVGSVILMMNTDDPEDIRNGLIGKVIDEELVDGERRFRIRWPLGEEDDDIKASWVTHV